MTKDASLWDNLYHARSLYPTVGSVSNDEEMIPSDGDQSAMIDDTQPVASKTGNKMMVWIGGLVALALVFHFGRGGVKAA